MLSNHSADTPADKAQQSSSVSGTKAAAEAPLLSPQDPIEVASGGNGTVNDPSGTDTRPPGYDDLDLLA